MSIRLSKKNRTLNLDTEGNNAFFLWGPRKTGKTTFLKQQFQDAVFFDLLDPICQTKFTLHPEELQYFVIGNHPNMVVLDEIQKTPALLDTVHWCLENTKTKFILCGSSARKLKRGAANLLGGRAWRYEMFPLTSAEIDNFDLHRALNHGLIPQHYLSDKPEKFLSGYLLEYIHEEIQAEASLRKMRSFEAFLHVIGTHHGQLINYANMARECGVSAPTIRGYFEILEDTLLGYTLPPWTKSSHYRLIETGKFYLFDTGVAKKLSGVASLVPQTSAFGHAFEHFILNEIRAFLSYTEKNKRLSFWRTSNGYEVDIIVGNMELAIEIKAKSDVKAHEIPGLQALLNEKQKPDQAIVISMDETKKTFENGVTVLPWQTFCHDLWAGKLV
jgi:predicted AAA+ superfamily ATPase